MRNEVFFNGFYGHFIDFLSGNYVEKGPKVFSGASRQKICWAFRLANKTGFDSATALPPLTLLLPPLPLPLQSAQSLFKESTMSLAMDTMMVLF
jgi:hypothetical protein